MNKYADVFLTLSRAPESQIEPSQTAILYQLSQRDSTPKSFELKEVLDTCAYASFASDFAMRAMDVLWQQMKKDEADV